MSMALAYDKGDKGDKGDKVIRVIRVQILNPYLKLYLR